MYIYDLNRDVIPTTKTQSNEFTFGGNQTLIANYNKNNMSGFKKYGEMKKSYGFMEY